jgi:hypothetical protein
MQKSMYEIHVRTEENRIIIEGPELTADPDSSYMTASIAISPEQVDGFIEYLKQAKEELIGK